MIDGPFAETKEQFLGFYVVDCPSLEEAIETAKELAAANPGPAPMRFARSATSSREAPRRDRHRLDRRGPDLGPPAGGRRAAALFSQSRHGRGGLPGSLPAGAAELAAKRAAAGPRRLADLRRAQRRASTRRAAAAKQEALPEEAAISDLEDAETELAERLDGADYRDDILRLLFICCHPDLPATQQIALALRIVSGLSVKQIARAFLVSESAMEQRITRAKSAIAAADVPFETPGAVERSERLAAVAAMVYLIFNEGYSASGGPGGTRAPLCDEAIRLGRLLLRLFPTEPEIMGLLALLLLQHARAAARFDADGNIVLMEDQDRGLWNREMIAEGLALIDKAMRHKRPGPYQAQAAIAALHARAERPEDTDWAQIDLLYAALETDAAIAGHHAQSRGRRLQGAGPGGGAGDDRAAGRQAFRLFPFLRTEGRTSPAARPHRGGPRRLRPGHRARQYRRGSRAYQDASRPPHEGRRAARRHQAT